MANDKFSYLSQIRALAKAKRDQLCPAQTATLVKADKMLAELALASATCEAQGQPLSKAFADGIASVIQNLLAFQSGYASNDPSQQIDPSAEPGFAPTNTVKAATTEKRISLGEFGALAMEVFKGLDGQPVHEAIKSVDGLLRIIAKAVLDSDPATVLIQDAVTKTDGGSAPVVAAPASPAVVEPDAVTKAAEVVAPAVAAPETVVAPAAPAAVAAPSIEELEKAGKKPAKAAGWPMDCNSPEFLGR